MRVLGTDLAGGKKSECSTCYNLAADAWQKRMAQRQHPAQFNMEQLIAKLLPYSWMHEVSIFQNDRGWMIMWVDPTTDEPSYLRYSKGPMQGTFWDSYGEDFMSPELALVMLSKAAPPPRVGLVIPTHGR